ncbi:hypothetical protein CHUAL_004667 [Chamberlinius hualienensis]
MYRNSDVYLLDDPLSAVDVRVGRHIWKNWFKASGKTIILVSHAVHLLDDSSFIVYLKEGQAISGTYEKLKVPLELTTASDNVDSNVLDSNAVNDIEVFNNSNLEENKSEETHEASPSDTTDVKLLWCRMAWNFVNGYGVIILMLFLVITGQAFGTSFDIFLSKWVYSQKPVTTNATVDEVQNTKLFFYLGFLILGESLFNIARTLVFFLLSINASLKLHKNMLNAVTKTKMSFFDSHQTGEIINRFSKDVEHVDDAMPSQICFLMRVFLSIIGVSANAIYSNYFVVIPFAVFIAVLGAIIYIYAKGSKHLTKLEANARSPIYSYMNCTINGIALIRSHDNQEKMKQEFDIRQNKHSLIWFLVKGTGYWMAMLCDLAANLLTISVILLTLLLPNMTNSSRLGIGISSSIILGGYLQVFIREVVDLDNLIISIERMVEYIMLPPEENDNNIKKQLPKEWPKLGKLSVKNLNLYYGTTKKKALEDISFEINPNEKIGIVGRTGAGKSSLIAALFQMTDTDGQIIIDEEDIKTLSLSEYRKKLSIIPQNPVILSGSIRRNLDPSNEFSDEDVWSSLDNVQLKDVIKSLTKGIEDDMSHFSVGQKQLFCLARTLLYNKKIIIFDEATSNIDNETDLMMQELIRKQFSNSTILVIAHRLQTVIDLDRIMVLHRGKLVEFDSPAVLLNNPNSMFRQMVLNAKMDVATLQSERL